MKEKKDKKLKLQGMKFGRLTVIEYYGVDKKRSSLWRCKCDCGNEKIVIGWRLKNGTIKSCGCLKDEKASQRRHKHGGSTSKLYWVWDCMKQRCNNPNQRAYKWYGAKGIKVCEEWLNDFTAFQKWAYNNGYKEGLSIDRIDPTKDYSPDNCQWITLSENVAKMNRNKKLKEDNKMIIND